MTTKTTFAGNGTFAVARPPSGAERRRLLRFGVIGCTSVAVDFAVFQLLAGSLSPHAAKAVSYLAGVVVGFVGNKFWTFESARRSAAEPILYLLVYAVTLGVNVGVNAVVAEMTGSTGLAFLAATGVTTVLNYLGLRLLAFRAAVRDRDQRETA
ncbi:GtrA family protein [Limnoglobus roseus]|uniref:GtrA-like protein n=1 Tax=Limnoglobus roseus TaxID=2598579 RepID=A0A5C1ANN8_9BACT|nr:GtrA family protein [Limnoglobus roseus]QEL20185.1 GtrA-like protein [Limnoglobus roseus]